MGKKVNIFAMIGQCYERMKLYFKKVLDRDFTKKLSFDRNRSLECLKSKLPLDSILY